MPNTHLKTAHEYGVKKALEKCGYASIADVEKDVQELGLIQPETKTGADKNVDDVFASLKTKLG